MVRLELDEEWAATSATGKLRRKVQNRLNQRASRHRKGLIAEERKQAVDNWRAGHPFRPLKPRGAEVGDTPLQQPRCSLEISEAGDRSPGISTLCCPIPRGLNTLRGLSPALEDDRARRNFFLAYTIRWPKYDLLAFPGGASSLSPHIFHSCIASPLMLDAVIAGIAHYRLLTSSSHVMEEDLRTLWEAQNRVSRGVREALLLLMSRAGGDTPVSDAVLNAVRLLGTRYHRMPSLARNSSSGNNGYKGHFRSVGIEHMGGLDLEGYSEFADEHYDVLKMLVASRGGLRTVAVPGIPEKLCRADILRAAVTFDHPSFDLCWSFDYVLHHELTPSRGPLSDASAFSSLDLDFKEILLDLQHCCRVLEQFITHDNGGCDTTPGSRQDDEGRRTTAFGLLGYYRDVMQHRLLQLPHGVPDMEVARLAVLVFTYGVTYPLPRPDTRRKASSLLLRALSKREYTRGQTNELMLWASVMGALGAGGTATEERFVQGHIAPLVASMQGVSCFADLTALCQRFLWVGVACEEGTRGIWDRVCH